MYLECCIIAKLTPFQLAFFVIFSVFRLFIGDSTSLSAIKRLFNSLASAFQFLGQVAADDADEEPLTRSRGSAVFVGAMERSHVDAPPRSLIHLPLVTLPLRAEILVILPVTIFPIVGVTLKAAVILLRHAILAAL